jgi:hypothetical protein
MDTSEISDTDCDGNIYDLNSNNPENVFHATFHRDESRSKTSELSDNAMLTFYTEAGLEMIRGQDQCLVLDRNRSASYPTAERGGFLRRRNNNNEDVRPIAVYPTLSTALFNLGTRGDYLRQHITTLRSLPVVSCLDRARS